MSLVSPIHSQSCLSEASSFDEIEAMRRRANSFDSEESGVAEPPVDDEILNENNESIDANEKADPESFDSEESGVAEPLVDDEILNESNESIDANEKTEPESVVQKSTSSVHFSPSMASEVTQKEAHLSPKKSRSFLSQSKESFPEEIESPESVLSTISDQPQTNHTSNTSTTLILEPDSVSKSYVPKVLANKQRVMGGGAAKLFGKPDPPVEDEDSEFENDGDDALEVKAPVEELMKSREQAIAEFSVGSPQNKRYHAPKKITTPVANDNSRLHRRILDRDEVFHQNATSAIVSILTPSNKGNSSAPEIADILSAKSTDIHLSPSNSKSGREKYTLSRA